MSLTFRYHFYLKIYIKVSVHHIHSHYLCIEQMMVDWTVASDVLAEHPAQRCQGPWTAEQQTQILQCAQHYLWSRAGTPLTWKTFFSTKFLNDFNFNWIFLFSCNQDPLVSYLPFCVMPLCRLNPPLATPPDSAFPFSPRLCFSKHRLALWPHHVLVRVETVLTCVCTWARVGVGGKGGTSLFT